MLFLLKYCSTAIICFTSLYTLLPSSALAEELALEDYFFSFPSCYARSYLANEGTAQQKVADIAISHFPSRQKLLGMDSEWQPYPDTPKFAAKLELVFSGHIPIHEKEWAWQTDAICKPEGERMKCSIECDGGHFFLQRHKKGLLLTGGTDLDFNQCDAGDRVLVREPEDKTFLLYRLPFSHCIPK